MRAGWRLAPEEVKDNPGLFWFQNGKSVVIIGREVFGGVSLGDYVGVLQDDGKFGALEDKKMELDTRGLAYYTATFLNAKEPNSPMRVDLKVWQTTASNYWRTISISPLQDETERAAARSLADELQKTSFPEADFTGSIAN